MSVSLVPRTILSLIQPAVSAVAARLFVLTTGRSGSRKFQPTVMSFYETGLVTSLYEQLLMSPVLRNYEIRHEMPYASPGVVGSPKRVDIWLRPVGGGYPHLIEAGDFSPGKVNRDCEKMRELNPNGGCWALAFFRGKGRPPANPHQPLAVMNASLANARGLDNEIVEIEHRLVRSFDVYRPDGNHDRFGVAMIRAR
ncbi:MAG TPA: hypothetical protein VGP76_27640 [Planctomycetaceae bacterium]|nr:hypothetical protein [Planctomycetaceae bacterium]